MKFYLAFHIHSVHVTDAYIIRYCVRFTTMRVVAKLQLQSMAGLVSEPDLTPTGYEVR